MDRRAPEPKPPADAETMPDDVPSVILYPKPGELIDGVYRIDRQIGRGGYGTVMLAHDEVLQRPVALKFVHPALTEVEGRRTRFLNEARAMARVHHPNVIGVYSVGQWTETNYLVMEYLPGPTLQTYLELRQFALDVDDAMGLFDQMCRGATAIHEVGATHNDLKPSNMIIGPASRLGIADFGLAEWVRAKSMRRGGTVGYIAPEVIRDDKVDKGLRTAADIYSLGVVAYILLTGRQPFSAATAEDVLDRQLSGETVAPSELRPELGVEFDEPILAALRPDPANRPAAVRELLQACNAAASSRINPTRSQTRILVIEDDIVMHPVLEASLHAVLPSAETMCFSDAVAALVDAEKHPPQLVITDLNMPDIDGFGVVEALRARASTRDVPIVAITGSATSDDWSRLTTLGADGFLTKPISPQTLRTVVRRMLARRS